ncbi:hypothetical protein GQ42DRAFT_164915, partial [Ramicandelaber brevisporus]
MLTSLQTLAQLLCSLMLLLLLLPPLLLLWLPSSSPLLLLLLLLLRECIKCLCAALQGKVYECGKEEVTREFWCNAEN